MSVRIIVSAGLALALAGVVVFAGSPATAQASTVSTQVAPAAFDPITPGLADFLAQREASGLPGYRVTVNAEQLTARGGTTERGAWSAQKGAMSAKDASQYNIRSTVGLEKGLGSVDPIRGFTNGQILDPKMWGKVPRPTYTGLGLSDPSSLLLLPATLGFEFRGKMTDGVLSFAGFSQKEDLVCGQQYSGASGGFVNWLTDVDCTMWEAGESFVPNLGMIARPDGWWANTGQAWAPGADSFSVQFSGAAPTNAGVLVGSVLVANGRFGSTFGTQYTCMKSSDGTVQPAPYDMAKSSGSFLVTGGSFTMTWACPAGQVLAGLKNPYVPNFNTPDANGNHNPQWGAKGTPNYTAGTEADPERTRVCEQIGSDGVTYSGETQVFHDSEIEANGWPAPVCAALPLGVTSESLRLIERVAGQPDKDLIPPQTADQTPETDALLGGDAAKYCQTKVCILDLIIKSSGLTCFSQGEACIGWWDEENHGDTKYQCNYAGHNVAIGECALYSHIFDTQKRYAGNPYSDPITGEQIGRQTGTSIDGLMMSGVPRASFSGRDCFGSGFGSANPLQWVLRPLQCFGEWAAVPRQSVVQSAQLNNTAAYDGKVVKVLPEMLASWNFVPPANGCSGIPIDVWFLGPPFNVMGACSGSMLAPMAFWARLFSALSITVLGVLALTRYAGKTFGYTGLGSGANS